MRIPVGNIKDTSAVRHMGTPRAIGREPEPVGQIIRHTWLDATKDTCVMQYMVIFFLICANFFPKMT